MAAKKTTKSVSKAPEKTPAPAAKKAAKKAATKAAAPPASKAKAPAAKKVAQQKVADKPTTDVIARAAYLIYRNRVENGLPGDSHNDWLEAERQLGVIR